MRIWYLGDSILSPTIAQLSDDVIDSSILNAIMEHVWTEQVHDIRMRGYKDDCIVIFFVNNPAYDSEVLIWNIINKVTENSKVILIVHPTNATAAEGMTHHYEGDRFKLVKLDNLSDAAQALQDILS